MRAAGADAQHNSSAPAGRSPAVDLSNNSISNRRPDKFTANITRQHRDTINATRHRPSVPQIIDVARVYTVAVVVRPCRGYRASSRVSDVDRLQCRSPLGSLSRRHIRNTTSGCRAASTATLTRMLIAECCLSRYILKGRVPEWTLTSHSTFNRKRVLYRQSTVFVLTTKLTT